MLEFMLEAVNLSVLKVQQVLRLPIWTVDIGQVYLTAV